MTARPEQASVAASTTRTIATALRIAVVVGLLIAFPGSSAGAQDGPAGSIELHSQTPWVLPDQAFALRVAVTSTLTADQLDIVVTVYGGLRNRSDFERSLHGRFAGSSVLLERLPLARVQGPDGTATVTLPVNDAAQPRFYLRNGGVYPVRVDLAQSGTDAVVDGFTTHLVKVAQPPAAANRLSVATVLPVEAPMSPDPMEAFALPEDGAGVAALARAVGSHPELAVTLVPRPETIERLGLPDDNGETPVLDALVAGAGMHDVVRTTWAPVPPDMYEPPLAQELEIQLRRGDDAVSAKFPAVDRRHWVALEPIDTAAAGKLREHGVERLVVPEDGLVPVRRDTTLARPFVVPIGSPPTVVPAVQADAGLARHFDITSTGPVLGGHHLLADLAVIWADRPAQTRGVVVMPPRGWAPNETFLRTFLDGLASSPIAAAVTLDGIFSVAAEGTRSNPLSRDLVSVTTDAGGPLPVDRLLEGRRRLTGYASMVSTADTPLDQLERRLLLAEATVNEPGHREGRLAAFERQLQQQFDAVQVPAERSLRLTSRQAEIPVSIQNDAGYPVDVVIRLASDKLEFPHGDSRLLRVERQHVTERIAVNARASGAFPVHVTVESPDGSLLLSKSTITIRSTATSAMGLGLTIGAGAFLLVWWARSVFRQRRGDAGR